MKRVISLACFFAVVAAGFMALTPNNSQILDRSCPPDMICDEPY